MFKVRCTIFISWLCAITACSEQPAPQRKYATDATTMLERYTMDAPAFPPIATGEKTAESPPSKQQVPNDPTSAYQLDSVVIDFKRYKIGDYVAKKYRSQPYQIVEWQKRHLPAPEVDSHWTYAGGNYLLITNARGQILKALSGAIFFSQ